MHFFYRNETRNKIRKKKKMSLKAIGLTHVRYDPEDKLGKFLALVTLLPALIPLAGFPALIFFRRELQTIFFFLGLILSEAINQKLKQTFRQPRPPQCVFLEACDSHGMPSSHSHFISFFAMYCTLLIVYRFKFSDSFSKVFSLLISWTSCFLVIWSRVYLGYHTIMQVLVGSLFGIFMGTMWFCVVHFVFSQYFDSIVEWPICRYLCIKDNSHIPNILLFEYNTSLMAKKKKL